jgi:hypothetical protein
LPSGEVERLVRVVSLLDEAETPLVVLREGLEQLCLENGTLLDVVLREVEVLVGLVRLEPALEVGVRLLVSLGVRKRNLVRGEAVRRVGPD